MEQNHWFALGITFLILLDPLGNLPVFVSVLRGVDPQRRQKVLIRELVLAYVVMLSLLLSGDVLLRAMGLRAEAVGVAGGVVLFLIALKMVFPPGGGESQPAELGGAEPFLVPLAVPLLAGPSIFAMLLLLQAKEPGLQWTLVGALTFAWGITAAVLLGASHFSRLLGERGMAVTERLMGTLLIAMAIQMILDGMRDYLRLGVSG